MPTQQPSSSLREDAVRQAAPRTSYTRRYSYKHSSKMAFFFTSMTLFTLFNRSVPKYLQVFCKPCFTSQRSRVLSLSTGKQRLRAHQETHSADGCRTQEVCQHLKPSHTFTHGPAHPADSHVPGLVAEGSDLNLSG